MLKILCPEPESFSKEGLDFASNIFKLTAKSMDQKQFESNLKFFDGVLIRFNTKITKELLSNNQNLRVILSPTTGLDHIDIGSDISFSVGMNVSTALDPQQT